MCGGIARYLNSYKTGHTFKLSIFFASAFVAGFSGYMFALIAETLHLPTPFPHVFAGVGGFFGDQAMKFIWEYLTTKFK